MPPIRARGLICAAILSVAALLPASPVAADHCGGGATIDPKVGPPGTTFVFRAGIGGSSVIRVYQEGVLVASRPYAEDGIRFEVTTGAGAAGTWRVRADHANQPPDSDCGAEATFVVTSLPDTATAAGQPPDTETAAGVRLMAALVAALTAFGLAHRVRGRPL